MNDDLFQKATLAHSKNNLKEAENLYLKLLNKNSENHQVHFLLGTLYLQKKLPKKALGHLKKSEDDDKNNPHLLMNLGLAYKQAGDMELSEIYLKKSLSIDPKNADSMNNLGTIQLSKKNYIDAEFNFRKALAIKPNEDAYLINLSECLFVLGIKNEPINLLLKIQRGSDFYQEAQTKLFNIFYETKNYRQCIIIGENLKKLISNKQEFQSKIFLSMLALGEIKQAKEQLNSFTNNDEKKLYKALLLIEELKYEESRQILISLSSKKDYELLCHHNLGVLNFKSNNFETATDHFKKALQKNSDFIESQIQLGLCQLSQCNFKEGWDNFYQYQNQKFFNLKLPKDLKKWDGLKRNCKILIFFDQGIGDQIFFSSLINSLPNLNQYYCLVNKKLLDIFKQSFSVNIHFLDENGIGNLKEYDFYIRATELAKFYITDINDLKKQKKYLKAKKLDFIEKRAIGLSWHSSNQRIGRKKSINLETLIISLKTKSKYFVNLQYGDFDDEIRRLSLKHDINFINHDSIDNFNNINGLAGLILACDEIYSISNTTAHLAGALGANVSLLLPFNHKSNTWYWFSNQNNRSLWYPNIKVIEAGTNQPLSSALKKIK